MCPIYAVKLGSIYDVPQTSRGIMTAIVASGYLFANELAYHVDVYEGDTPTTLLERHASGATVKNAAVIDIDIPGNSEPLPLEADEPVVVVGNSPRTSVFVYGEGGERTKNFTPTMQEGVGVKSGEHYTDSVAAAAAPAPKLTPSKQVKDLQPKELVEDGTTEIEVEDLMSHPQADEEATTDPTTPLAETVERPFSRTRRVPKSKANRHTRRITHIPKSLKIELA